MTDTIDFLDDIEAVRLNAYLDSSEVPTIGIGNTYYRDGRRVRMGDKITREEAYSLAELIVLEFSTVVKQCLTVEVNRNQFIALTSLCYNAGKTGFRKSIIVKMVNANPNDPAIKEMFTKSFVTSKGQPSKGLVNRRRIEAKKYFQV
jgi:lysozyme